MNRYFICFLSAAVAAGSAFAEIEMLSPAPGSVVTQLGKAQAKFVGESMSVREKYFDAGPNAEALKKDGYRPKPIAFHWKGGKAPYKVVVRRKSDGKVFYEGVAKGHHASVDSLEIAREWEWTVSGGGESATGTFFTEDRAPRLINIEGVPNARDLGGRIGLDGRRIRQGLLFRTAGLNDNAPIQYYSLAEVKQLEADGKLASMGEVGASLSRHLKRGDAIAENTIRLVKKSCYAPGKERLTAAERERVLKLYGFKTDIDLRGPNEVYGMTQSPLGPSVKWANIQLLGGYGSFAQTKYSECKKSVFRILFDRSAYPIVFHCIGGADRTGTIAFMVEALLGVDDDNLAMDYLTTGFCGGVTDQRHKSWFDGMARALKSLPGATNAVKMNNLLLKWGFSQKEIDDFREWMLEPAPPAGAEFQNYNVIPFSPGTEARTAAEAVEYRARTGCDLVLYSLTLHPEGKPAMEKVERYVESYRALRRALEGTNVRLGVLVQAILGHWPRVDKDIEDWTRTVDIKGRKVRFCPDDPGFAKYITDTFVLLAKEKPAFILTDDDVRAYSHDAECFCPRHVAEFNSRRGTNYTEKELREKVSAAAKTDPDYTTFLAVQRDMMNRLAARFRAAMDSVDPTIPAGICVAGEETFLVPPMARAIAAKGQRPVMRVGTGCYNERFSTHLPSNIFRTMGFAEYYRGWGIDILDEADTCPQNLWSKSARSFFTHLAAAAFLGYRGAKIWYVNGHRGDWPVTRSYTDVLAAQRGVLDALVRESTAPSYGVAVPCFTNFPAWHLAKNHNEMFMAPGTFAERVLLPFGIPFRAERDFSRDGVYVVSRKAEVARFTDAELDQVFSHKVLVTAEAAIALTARGRSDLIGLSASAKEFRFNGEREVAGGASYVYAPMDHAPFFSDLAPGAEKLTVLGFSPYRGSPVFEEAAPGAVLFKNALGGTVATCAYHGGMYVLHQFSEGRKRFVVSLLDRLMCGQVRYVCGNDQDVLVLAREGKDGRGVVLAVNLNSEPIETLRFRAPGAASAEAMSPGGVWRPVRAHSSGEWLELDETLGFYEAKAFRFVR